MEKNDGSPFRPGDSNRPQPLWFENRRDLLIYAYLRIKQTRRYWLLPVLGLIALLGLFLNLFTGHNVLPAIYSLIP